MGVFLIFTPLDVFKSQIMCLKALAARMNGTLFIKHHHTSNIDLCQDSSATLFDTKFLFPRTEY